MVRDAAVSALLAMYSDADNVQGLATFRERFAMRIAELIYDVDHVVAVKGVRVAVIVTAAGAVGSCGLFLGSVGQEVLAADAHHTLDNIPLIGLVF